MNLYKPIDVAIIGSLIYPPFVYIGNPPATNTKKIPKYHIPYIGLRDRNGFFKAPATHTLTPDEYFCVDTRLGIQLTNKVPKATIVYLTPKAVLKYTKEIERAIDAQIQSILNAPAATQIGITLPVQSGSDFMRDYWKDLPAWQSIYKQQIDNQIKILQNAILHIPEVRKNL